MGAILVIVLGIAAAKQQPRPKSIQMGAEMVLTSSSDPAIVLVPSTDFYFEQYHRSVSIGDSEGAMALLLDGDVLIVEVNTRVRVIDMGSSRHTADYSKYKVRMLEGSYAGATGWVGRDSLGDGK